MGEVIQFPRPDPARDQARLIQEARALYESEGFGQVGKRRGYYEDGTDALVLAKKLQAKS